MLTDKLMKPVMLWNEKTMVRQSLPNSMTEWRALFWSTVCQLIYQRNELEAMNPRPSLSFIETTQ